MGVEYNRSANAARAWVGRAYRSVMGKSTVDTNCPFCNTFVIIYVWSLSGGGKKCPNKKCGAKFGSMGQCFPVVGRENPNENPDPRNP